MVRPSRRCEMARRAVQEKGVSIKMACQAFQVSETCYRYQPLIRCNNGPENISGAMQTWAGKRGIKVEYIESGQPQQNAYIERFNRTVRYDWLAQKLFDSIDEVQDQATRWMWHYNRERPNMALGGITPNQRLAIAA